MSLAKCIIFDLLFTGGQAVARAGAAGSQPGEGGEQDQGPDRPHHQGSPSPRFSIKGTVT